MPSPHPQSLQANFYLGERILGKTFSFGTVTHTTSLIIVQWQLWVEGLGDHFSPLRTSVPLPISFQSLVMLGKCNLKSSLFSVISNP